VNYAKFFIKSGGYIEGRLAFQLTRIHEKKRKLANLRYITANAERISFLSARGGLFGFSWLDKTASYTAGSLNKGYV
jgi:hypothetical protein